jgi:hypothetical protein
MGRYDELTKLDENRAPALQPDIPPGAPAKPHSPPVPGKPVRQKTQGTDARHNGTGVPEPVRVPVGVREGVPPPVPLIPKAKRVIRQRQPFDIYEDQYQRLKRIAEEEKGFENGRGMSQMVREAIDTYLQDHDTSAE